MIVIYGTASSGKSKVAEDMAVKISTENNTELTYIATMESESDAAKARIKKHRAQREGKGFNTIEEPDRLRAHSLTVRGQTVLLECVSNFCANVYYKKFADKIANSDEIVSLSEYIVSQILSVSSNVFEIIIVTNDVFSDGRKYDPWTEAYIKILALVNEELMRKCDCFYEVTVGIPKCLKGNMK